MISRLKTPATPVVSSYLITKGAMVEETCAVFREWDFSLSQNANLRRMQETNSVGATSSKWLEQVYKVLHRRFEPQGRDRPLIELAQRGIGDEIFKPILLWHMTRDELLVRDFLIHWLFPRFQEAQRGERSPRLRREELHPYLSELHAKGWTKAPWTESTLGRVASGLLRIAIDFALLRGSMAREMIPYQLPEDAFLYLLYAMVEAQPNAHAVVHSPEWRMFQMSSGDVESELLRLHQYRRVHYEVAGSLAQLTLPRDSAAVFALDITV